MTTPTQLSLFDTPPDENPRKGEYQIPATADTGRYAVSHFVDCPEGKDWSKR